MPNNYEIVDNTTGEVLVVTGETPPTPEDAAMIFAQQRQQQRIAPRATPQLPPVAPTPSVVDLGMEAIAGFNRPFAWLMDNTLMAPVNTVRGFQGNLLYLLKVL